MRHMKQNEKESAVNQQPSTKNFIITLLVTTVLFGFLQYYALQKSQDSTVGALGYIPVILLSWKFGIKRGLIAAVIILSGSAINFYLLAPPNVAVSNLQPIIGSISHIIIVCIFGALSELVNKLKGEIATRKKIEAELQKYREHLEELVKERTEELEQANEHLRQAEKMEALGQLTGGIVHDFNNMLGGIIGFADLIKRKYAKNDPTLQNYTNMIFKTSDRAAELISKLLIFSRKGQHDVEAINVHEIIINTLKLLEHSIDKKVKISHTLSDETPIVMGDYTQLQNVFINLAVNARDAMPEGGTLTFSSETVYIDDKYNKTHPLKLSSGTYIMISITDTGTGMDENVRKRIFDPFFTTKDAGKGTGMGLASSYGTMKKHNGSIEVYSEPGKGTTFKVYLPLSDDKDTSIAEKTGEILMKGSGSVLLIDDEEVMREVGSEMLSDLGYSVTTCNDGQEGVEYYRQHYKEVDYVILDIMMPNLDGYSCFQELKEINPDVSVIIASGYTIDGLASDLINEGARAFIQKPFDTIRLSKAIEKSLHKK